MYILYHMYVRANPVLIDRIQTIVDVYLHIVNDVLSASAIMPTKQFEIGIFL